MLHSTHIKEILSLEFLPLDIPPSIQHGPEFALIPLLKPRSNYCKLMGFIISSKMIYVVEDPKHIPTNMLDFTRWVLDVRLT